MTPIISLTSGMFSLLGAILATLLTLAIFSRAFAETRAFRWAAHLLLGMGAGYVAAIALKSVLLPALTPAAWLHSGQVGIGFVAGALIAAMGLRFAAQPELRAWGLPSVGLVAGVAAALALAGAVRGTLLPQLMAPFNLTQTFFPGFPALDALSVIAAALTTLGVLFYLLPWENEEDGEDSWARWLFDGWRLWGYWALMLALGAFLASMAGARITLLIERVQWLLGLWF